MKIKSIISLILALVLCTALLASCKKDEEPVMTIESFEVSPSMYRYVLRNAKADVEAKLGEGVWNSTGAKEAEAEAAEIIRDYLAKSATVVSLAKEYGIYPDSTEVKSDVEYAIAEIIEDYEVEEDFYNELEELGLDDELLRELTTNSVLNDKLYDAIVKADEKASDKEYLAELFASDALIRVKQILTGGENGGTDEENLKKAEDLYERLQNGADFDTLAQTENCDLFMFQNDDGYYILRGTRDVNFEEAAFALELGEMSEVVKTDVGYTIIKRYEKDESYIEENFEVLTEEYCEGIYTSKFESRLEEIKKSLGELPEGYEISELQ